MTETDRFLFLRTADTYSVMDAAALMAGAHPHDPYEYNGSTKTGLRVDAEKALKGAIAFGKLKARLVYEPKLEWERDHQDDKYLVIAKELLPTSIAEDLRHIGDKNGNIVIQREPNWEKSEVAADDLRQWLRKKGRFPAVIFSNDASTPSEDPTEPDYLDPAHERFAPELAMAVRAWQGVTASESIRVSVKQALRHWILHNKELWRGSSEPSEGALNRMSTVANWQPQGGAPRTE